MIIITRISLIMALFFMIGKTYSQVSSDSTKRTKEFIITSTSLFSQNYGLQYKVQIRKNKFWRFEMLHMQTSESSYTPETTIIYPSSTKSSNIGLTFGIEFRKTITKFFELVNGVNFQISSDISTTKFSNPSLSTDMQETTDLSANIGIGYIFGGIIQLNDRFYIGAEIVPTISRNGVLKEGYYETQATNFNINSSRARLSLIYRFK